MACNENVIKNMASEITRNCQSQNVNVEMEFVVFLVEFQLLDPKYGKLFSKTLNRNNLEYFVNECGAMIIRGGTSLNTLKMQFIMQKNYDKLQNLVDRHLDSMEACLSPLLNEILDEYPEPEDVNAMTKLYRKISIYLVIACGLGSPSVFLTLKEGMAALESVFSIEDLELFVSYTRTEKVEQIDELLAIVSGVRLFNRDCKKSGEMIPDLPENLMDAGKACLSTLSHSLIAVMQRVNKLTTAVADCISIDDETGNVFVKVPSHNDLSVENYKQMFDLLAFNRQYEVFIRRLLSDMEVAVQNGFHYVEKDREVLGEVHEAVKYKEAVPVVTVFPLFANLWEVWRSMQNIMYLISTVNRLMAILGTIRDHTKVPQNILDIMLRGKSVVSDQERMGMRVSVDDRLSLAGLPNYVAHGERAPHRGKEIEVGMRISDVCIQFLGFCTMCLTVGALVPSNVRLGLIRCGDKRYGFCNVKMAVRFSKDPYRYINEVMHYARKNPQIIQLLNIFEDVEAVKDIDTLIVKHVPKIKVSDQEIQTDVHPIEQNLDRNYSSSLWEWKRRACQWATIVKCRTHSTQTLYSHLRSEIPCQTFEPRDKCLQTKKDAGINTNMCQFFLWGLRGQVGDGQHSVDLVLPHADRRLQAKSIETCKWPCINIDTEEGGSSNSSQSVSDIPLPSSREFYNPDAGKKPDLFRTESRMQKSKMDNM